MEIGKRASHLPFIGIQNQRLGLNILHNPYAVGALWIANSNIIGGGARSSDPGPTGNVKISGYPIKCYLVHATCPIY